MLRWIVIAALIAAPVAAVASEQQPEQIPALEVALDAQKYNGKLLTITNCKLYGIMMHGGPCAVYRKGQQIDAVGVDFSMMPKKQRLMYIDRCGDFDPGRKCIVNITGEVRARGFDAFIIPSKIIFKYDK